MTVVVNFFGGPGVGKSTVSADLYSRLKKRKMNVELVQEYMKELIWDNRKETFNDQLYILAKQNRRLSRLVDKVDVVVTDSPIPLGTIYAEMNGHEMIDLIRELSDRLFNGYTNINVVLTRKYAHVQEGRIHTEQQSIHVDNEVLSWLNKNDHRYIILTDESDLDLVVHIIEEMVNA